MQPADSSKKKSERPKTDLQKCQGELEAAYSRLEDNAKELEAYKREHKKIEAADKEKDAQISRLGTDLTDLTQENLKLTRALEETLKHRPSISIDELVGQLRTSLETLNEEARQRPQQGREQILVDQFEVEIKGGIDLKDGFRLTQLQGQEISPQSVSTIRFALRPSPVVTTIDDSTTNK